MAEKVGSVLNPERTTKTTRLAIAMAMCLALVVGPVLFLVGTSNPRPQTLKAIGVAGAARQDQPRPTAAAPEPSPTDSLIPPSSGDGVAPTTDVPPPPTTPVTSSASIPAKSSVVTVKATVTKTVSTTTVPKATTTTVSRPKPTTVVTTPTTKTPPSTIPALGTPLPPTPTGSVKAAAAPSDASFHPSHNASGKASWYHAPDATCASLTIPRGTKVRVTNTANGSSAICTIADYGPTDTSRIIDLSYDTFSKLAAPAAGLVDVHIEW